MTHDSFDVSAELLAEFQQATGITIEVFKAGDGGAGGGLDRPGDTRLGAGVDGHEDQGEQDLP